MKKYLIICALAMATTHISNAQNNDLPYYEIPDYPETYTATNVAARMLDGLGFRYYWATEGLRDEDLKYKPSVEGRTTSETIDHLHGLTTFILNSALKKVHEGVDVSELTFEEKRKQTLMKIKEAADIMRTTDDDLSKYKIVFQRGENTNEFPFWNNINGPIADALWHCGQVVLLRRASGNPFNSKASVFTGKVKQ